MLVETVSDAHVHFHYSARRFRDVLLANILATQNKNKVLSFLHSFLNSGLLSEKPRRGQNNLFANQNYEKRFDCFDNSLKTHFMSYKN